MNRQPDPRDSDDDKLSALYRTHLGGGMPSAASDDRVLQMARDAAAVGSAKLAAVASVGSRRKAVAAGGGWRSWLSAPWFGPGLAFATVASLSVIVVALMPNEEVAIERDIAAGAPVAERSAASPSAASASAPADSATASALADSAAASALADSPSAAPSSSAAANAARAPDAPPAPSGRADTSTPFASQAQDANRESRRRAASEPAARMKAAPAEAKVAPVEQPSRTMLADRAAQSRQQGPNPFPAQSMPPAPPPAPRAASAAVGSAPGAGAGAAPAAMPSPPPSPAPVAEAGRIEKPSLLSEPADARTGTIAEVPDSAPTYPNEARPSIPLPYTYQMPRKSRDASAGGATAVAPQSTPRVNQQSLQSTRRDEAVERRTLERSGAPAQPPSLAAAHAPRDPAEWVKAIMKLKTEGRTEQMLKELADFRRLHPQHALPEELRNLSNQAR